MKNTKKNYSDFAFIADLELLKRYQAREAAEIISTKNEWDKISKQRRSDFKYNLIIEALTSMHADGFRPATCLYTIIQNFDSIFEEDI
jgi:hypothetical protein